MDKFIISIIAVSLIVVIAGSAIMSGNTGTDSRSKIEVNENTKIVLDKTSHDWGTIGLNDGNVEHVFEVKNEGTEELTLSNIVTSCMCTTAQLILNDQQSPVFGMHTKSDYQLNVPAGETALLKIVFDPAFHGPSGVGPINRQITVDTNNPDKSKLQFTLTAMVTK